jgi:hypothetical protein
MTVLTEANADYLILAARLHPAQVGFYWRAFQLGVCYQDKISGIMLRTAFPDLCALRRLGSDARAAPTDHAQSRRGQAKLPDVARDGSIPTQRGRGAAAKSMVLAAAVPIMVPRTSATAPSPTSARATEVAAPSTWEMSSITLRARKRSCRWNIDRGTVPGRHDSHELARLPSEENIGEQRTRDQHDHREQGAEGQAHDCGALDVGGLDRAALDERRSLRSSGSPPAEP